MQESKDICFEIGRLLMGLKEYAGAVEFFKRSQELCGQHHVTWHNMGICLYYQDALEDAEKCFEASLSLKATYMEAQSWLAQVREKIAKGHVGLPAARDGTYARTGSVPEYEPDDSDASDADGHAHAGQDDEEEEEEDSGSDDAEREHQYAGRR